MSTQMHRIFTVLMVALMVGLVAVGWFLVAQPQIAAAASANDQLESAQSQIASSEANLADLKTQKSKMGELTTELAQLQQSIPSTLASSPLVSGIDQQAKAAGVVVNSIAVNDAVTYAPTTAGATTTAASGSSGSSPTPSPSASATAGSAAAGPIAPAATKGFVPKTDSSITPDNFIPVPVTISVAGHWDQVLAFMKNLQTGSRLYAVGTIAAKADSSDSSTFKASITGYVFAIIDPTDPGAGTAQAVKKSTPTATPTPAPTTAAPKPAATTAAAPSATPTPSASASASGK